MPLHVASLDDIRNNRVTDLYFENTVQVLRAKNADRVVSAEIRGSVPPGSDFGLLCGVEEMLAILEGLPVEVEGLPEGSYFRERETVMTITGPYTEFARLETAILGVLCQASGVMTQAARCKLAAGHRTVISFGARRMHPAVAPMIERAAYLGGCDGFSVVMAGDLLGVRASGTMPHALILVAGALHTALLWFDEVVDPTLPRIALIDTYDDEKFSALIAAETLGAHLTAVRLDTPGSRRGNMLELLREVRWELDLRGYERVGLFVSGGVTEAEILRLNESADGYGVGTSISSAGVCDMALDIIAIGDEPVAKRGKKSGRKQLLACPECGERLLVPREQPAGKCRCGQDYQPLLVPLMREGKIIQQPSVPEIRAHCLAETGTWAKRGGVP
jgi:nicotinate phosphoribosyltransferase